MSNVVCWTRCELEKFRALPLEGIMKKYEGNNYKEIMEEYKVSDLESSRAQLFLSIEALKQKNYENSETWERACFQTPNQFYFLIYYSGFTT